jgi:hypothetical protein
LTENPKIIRHPIRPEGVINHPAADSAIHRLEMKDKNR